MSPKAAYERQLRSAQYRYRKARKAGEIQNMDKEEKTIQQLKDKINNLL